MALSTIEEAIEQLRNGGMVVVVDDEDRENEGDLIMAAEDVTPESMAFFLEHTSGVFCVPLESTRADELDGLLPRAHVRRFLRPSRINPCR